MHVPADRRPLVLHVVYRFAVGGLENGLVNLINRLPFGAWRHGVVSLTDISPEFCRRVQRVDVLYEALDKDPGHLVGMYPRLFRLFRKLQPAIVHTRNMAALEATLPAWAAGVPIRIHGEHGWDAADLDGSNARLRWTRRAFSPFVTSYVALSQHLQDYLSRRIGIRPERIAQIYNGVDATRFSRPGDGRPAISGCPFSGAGLWLVGTVGRMEAVKDPANLARAFVRAIERDPTARTRLRLVMVGDGTQKAEVEHILGQAGLAELAWLPGERDDVPEILRGLDCFVLPSRAEGVSNTILEAMSSGLPVVATRVGGNAELVEDRLTGRLVPPADGEALATRILDYSHHPDVARRHGKAGRNRVERQFSLDRMVAEYDRLYRHLLQRRGVPDPSLTRA
ncbi:MAG: TIGR03088 family PEP-CTERM/XrtA system glycosyltransferase [Burkholderiales bacterium]|nr:TIGR03088 family PEP-CTERM/XrtA system glycosyltransferase [Burkholderiales bacterium]